MAIRIIGTEMALMIGEEIVATARFSKPAVADGNGAWIVSCLGQAGHSAAGCLRGMFKRSELRGRVAQTRLCRT
jgi:hypothetical protein